MYIVQGSHKTRLIRPDLFLNFSDFRFGFRFTQGRNIKIALVLIVNVFNPEVDINLLSMFSN